MDINTFEINLSEFFLIENNEFLNSEKNSNIGKLAVEIVKHYFISIKPNCKFIEGKNNEPDLILIDNKIETPYEIKGTRDKNLAFNKIKISSKYCHDKIKDGMEIIRVTNIGESKVKIHFLKNGIDFKMEPEDRWKVKKI